MLEAYTTLGYLAARTSKVDLVTWVTAVVYREPGMLAKLVSTLDVLSGGRAWLGIGAAWNEEEARGLGLPFPPTAERFERLEETLQICLQMWSDDDGPYSGKHYQLGADAQFPASHDKPHPPILIGGGGEKKTLRLVAKYAQACNLFPSPELAHKLDVLREHCAREGRDYDDIEKTVMWRPRSRRERRERGRNSPATAAVWRPGHLAGARNRAERLETRSAEDARQGGGPGDRRLVTGRPGAGGADPRGTRPAARRYIGVRGRARRPGPAGRPLPIRTRDADHTGSGSIALWIHAQDSLLRPAISSMSTPCWRRTRTCTPMSRSRTSGWSSEPPVTAGRAWTPPSTGTTSWPSPRRSASTAPSRAPTVRCSSGADTHALSGPATATALEVFAANGVTVMLDSADGYTPTPAVSHAILKANRKRTSKLADGICVTPSHNPPRDGGFKYNPPNGGPADSDATSVIAARANDILAGGLVRREADELRVGEERRHHRLLRLHLRLRR